MSFERYLRTKYTTIWYNKRRQLTDSYKEWFYVRFIKITALTFQIWCIILIISVLMMCNFDDIYSKYLASKSISTSLVIILVLTIVHALCNEVQRGDQSYIDLTLLGDVTGHLFEFFPHKGIWVHRREAFLYNMRARRFKRAIRKSVAFPNTLGERRVRRFHRSNLPFSNKRNEAKKAAAKDKALNKH